MSKRFVRWFLVPAIGLGVAFVGCTKSGQENEQSGTVTQLSQETNQELDHFKQDTQTRLDSMKKELDALHAQAQTLTGDEQTAANQKLDKLDKQYQNMMNNMNGMHDAMVNKMQGMMGEGGKMMGRQHEAAQEAWDELRTEMNQGMEQLNDGIDSMKEDLTSSGGESESSGQ
jgi:predicted phage gp36 major capsid-like protein